MRSILSAIVVTFALAPCVRADDFKLEDGFSLLISKDLTGWKTEKGDSLDGKSEAFTSRFTLKDGVLHIDPKVKGDVKIFTTKEFDKDVQIKLDFLPDAKCNNDLFLRGIKFDLSAGNVKDWKVGEWNSLEIILKGDKAEFKLNDKAVKTIATKGKATGFGIRAEFGEMKVRRLRVKEG